MAVVDLGSADEYPPLLTIGEVAEMMKVSPSTAYALARQYEMTDGREGLPNLRFGTCIRVPRPAFMVLITTGRVVRLADGTEN